MSSYPLRPTIIKPRHESRQPSNAPVPRLRNDPERPSPWVERSLVIAALVLRCEESRFALARTLGFSQHHQRCSVSIAGGDSASFWRQCYNRHNPHRQTFSSTVSSNAGQCTDASSLCIGNVGLSCGRLFACHLECDWLSLARRQIVRSTSGMSACRTSKNA